MPEAAPPKCRLCRQILRTTFCDLGSAPLANSLVAPQDSQKKEAFFPLRVYVCDHCLLVQLEEFQSPNKIFSSYPYFSSYSATWVEHAKKFAQNTARRFGLAATSLVIEIGSNDGYLLTHFRELGVPSLGIEPASNVADVARSNGIETISEFFGSALASKLVQQKTRADLVVANNVMAHVPDLLDFVRGLAIILAPDGVISIEFPHLLRLIQDVQFDTIYHEHFSYFSLRSTEEALRTSGLRVFDAEELGTHGGSLRIYACHNGSGHSTTSERLELLRHEEKRMGLDQLSTYAGFEDRVRRLKRELLALLDTLKREGKTIVGYGAAAKGSTLLNYCGIRTNYLEYIVDRNPHKQGNLLPGVHIPIVPPQKIFETQPDYLLILPWNIASEITSQMSDIRKWGGRFIIPVPRPTVMP
ncbi:MAG TPA: class I SAM-dependent methyltransferase [Bdellovibrionota bacterium]|nr:class I SAM-dependent methyltransferase [Bdellovibrionota bacterium]